jgi:N-acetyl-anhydromuramyl-L-alanine amidase AmpD
MDMNEKIAWNQARAKAEGWTASLFGCKEIDASFVNAVALFQKENGLTPDGLCGSNTIRRKYSEDMSDITTSTFKNGGEYIIANDRKVRIYWDKVTTFDEQPEFKAQKGFHSPRSRRTPNFFVTHWDVTLSSSHCFRILFERGLMVHFLIDNDGRIIQTCDMNLVCYHAGSSLWNENSIGVEISNAYDMKWQSWYQQKGFGSRPVVKGAKAHGSTLEDHLGFYDVQERALAALWEAVSFAYGIPLRMPTTTDGVDPECAKGTFHGFIHHYNLTQKKIDCAGMDNAKVLSLAHKIREQRTAEANKA